jgi:hypothetical protein
MTPQTLAIAGTLVSFIAGILASRGIISRETADYLGGPETLAFIGAVGAVAVGAYGLWRGRPHGLIQDAAALPQVDAVITKQKTADEITAGNVVGSVDDAAKVVPARSHKTAHAAH